MMNLILASASPRRREILALAGIGFRVMVPPASLADESAVVPIPSDPAKTVRDLAEMKSRHEADLAGLKDPGEIKDEKYVYKNRQFDAKLKHEATLQEIKDRRHDAYMHRYHLIDLLRLSRFTFAENQKQKWENYKYTFNVKQFLLTNGLYIAIICIFVILCILAPIVKHTKLLTMTNILNILQAASPRMFLALGVGGLILLGGTDLSVGRMVGTSMVLSTMIMHKGINTGALFGHIFDFSGLPVGVRMIMALVVCCCVTTTFTSFAGFFSRGSVYRDCGYYADRNQHAHSQNQSKNLFEMCH